MAQQEANQCRKQAAECREQAFKAASPQEQQALLRKAAEWFKLASSEDKPSQH